MIALVRYLGADAARSQRWVPPLLLFLAGVALFNTDAGSLLSTYGDTVASLLPVAAWLAVAVVDSEDPIQATITTATVGSDPVVRLAKLATAWLACVPLAVMATAWPVIAGDHPQPLRWGDVAWGFVAHLVVALGGVAIGSVVSRGVIRKLGWSFFLAAALCLADVAIAGAPPLRRTLDLFDRDHPAHLGTSLGLTGLETVVLGAALIGGSVVVARRRT